MIRLPDILLGYYPAGSIMGYVERDAMGYAKSASVAIPGPPIDFSDPLNSMYVAIISAFV